MTDLANEIWEMKHVSIFSINSTLMKPRSLPPNFWSSTKPKLFSTIGTPITIIIIFIFSIGLYCKCFQNKKGCVGKYTRPHSLPPNNTQIELEAISPPLPDTPDHMSLQIIPEILKTSGVDFSKFKHYKCCKAKCQATNM